MQNPELTIEKQQRLLRRSIASIKVQAERALSSGLTADFINVETASRELKEFVRTSVTAPEIIAYTRQIKKIRHESAEPGLMRIFTMNIFSLFSGDSVRAKGWTINDTRDVIAQYSNLEILVEMMDGE
jgi:hypothetical protein